MARTPPEGRFDDSARLLPYLATRDVPCPSCGYNLRGIGAPRCPECGVAVTYEGFTAEPDAPPKPEPFTTYEETNMEPAPAWMLLAAGILVVLTAGLLILKWLL